MRFNICNCAVVVLDEVATCLAAALRRLGHETVVQHGILDSTPGTINITLAVFSAPVAQLSEIESLIVFNLEQIGAHTITPIRQSYFKILKQGFVWDYSAAHLPTLKLGGVNNAAHVPLGYSPEFIWSFSPPEYEDLDVVFYGTLTPRREKIINELRERGISVYIPQTEERSGGARDRIAARAKILLNIACFDNVHTLEMLRIAQWLTNKKTVLSEIRPDTVWDRRLEGAFVASPYDGLVDTCAKLLADADFRRAQANRGFEIFANGTLPSFDDAVAAGVKAYKAYVKEKSMLDGLRPKNPPLIPLTLNVCSHSQWNPIMFNASPNAIDEPDIVFNLNEALGQDNSSQFFDTWRYGPLNIARGAFTRVQCYLALGDAKALANPMDHFAWFLKSGGTLSIHQLYEHGSITSPKNGETHCDEHYFDDWLAAPHAKSQFRLIRIVHLLSEFGMQRHNALAASRHALAQLCAEPDMVHGIEFVFERI